MREKYHVPAVLRTFQLLEYLAANREATFAQVQRDCGLPRSTAFHLLNTFQEAGYARRAHNGAFRLTSKMHELSNLMLSHLDIRNIAMPFMRRFARDSGLGCNLGLIVGDEAIYGAKVDSDLHMLTTAWLGKPLSLMGSSLGKVLMAWRDEQDIREMLVRNPLRQKTEKTETDVDSYLASLEQIRRDGFAWDREEVTAGVSCLAEPVRDDQGQIVAAISLSAATTVFTAENTPVFHQKLRETIRDIESSLAL